jgi:hypothetical protein
MSKPDSEITKLSQRGIAILLDLAVIAREERPTRQLEDDEIEAELSSWTQIKEFFAGFFRKTRDILQ